MCSSDLAELLAIVLVLARTGFAGEMWSELGITSLFVQWVALTTAVALCALRQPLAQMQRHMAATRGPYRWSGYSTSFSIDLESVYTGNEVSADSLKMASGKVIGLSFSTARRPSPRRKARAFAP